MEAGVESAVQERSTSFGKERVLFFIEGTFSFVLTGWIQSHASLAV